VALILCSYPSDNDLVISSLLCFFFMFFLFLPFEIL
jgi:hypothetical protein